MQYLGTKVCHVQIDEKDGTYLVCVSDKYQLLLIGLGKYEVKIKPIWVNEAKMEPRFSAASRYGPVLPYTVVAIY